MYNESKRLSKTGATLIQGFEKCVLTAYQDDGGVWTIGWGSTTYPNGKSVKEGDTVTQEQADGIFLVDIVKFEQMLRPLVKKDLEQREFDSLVSFVYNAGTSYKGQDGKWHHYNLFDNVSNGMHGKELTAYWTSCAVHSGGKVSDGLIRRRKAEVLMFNTGVLNFFE